MSEKRRFWSRPTKREIAWYAVALCLVALLGMGLHLALLERAEVVPQPVFQARGLRLLLWLTVVALVSFMPLLMGVFLIVRPLGDSDRLLMFTAHMASVARQNLPLAPGLRAFAEDAPKEVQGCIGSVAAGVENGLALSVALERWRGLFPPVYRAMVRAGEQCGNLAGVFERLKEFRDHLGRARARLVMSIAYPLLLSFLLVGMSQIMSRFVWPALDVLPVEFGADRENGPAVGLALGTARARYLLAEEGIGYVSGALVSLWLVLTLGALLYRFGSRKWRWCAVAADSLRWVIPGFRSHELRVGAARFADTLSMLLEAGVPIVEAARLATEASPNMYLRKMLWRSTLVLEKGKPFREAFSEGAGYPATFAWHVSVGESSGKLPASLFRAARALDLADRALLAVAREAIFPTLIIIIGVMAGLIASSTFGTLLLIMDQLI